MEKLLSPNEVSEMLHVTTNCLRQWEIAGKIKCVKTLGGHRRYKLEDIKKMLEEKSA